MRCKQSIAWGICLLFSASVSGALGQDESSPVRRGPGNSDVERPQVEAAAAPESGYLGMTVDLTAPEGKPVYIVSVIEGEPAASAGLKPNDVILEVNGKLIGGLDDLDRLVRQPAGTELEFKIRRDGVPQRFAVTLGALPVKAPSTADDDEQTFGELPPPLPPAAPRTEPPSRPVPRTEGGPSIVEGSRPSLGISVTDVSDLTKRRFGITVDTGAVIVRIREGTPAALSGLPLGGVIVSINGQRIGTADDIVELIQAFRPGEEVEVTYFEGDRVGRKRIRLGRSAVAVIPDTSSSGDAAAASPSDPPLRLGRRRSGRPLLDALERTLDAVLPPASEPPPAAAPEERRSTDVPEEAMVPPPPPPAPRVPGSDIRDPNTDLEPPAVELPAPYERSAELNELRLQVQELQKQLEVLLRRIEQMEKKR